MGNLTETESNANVCFIHFLHDLSAFIAKGPGLNLKDPNTVFHIKFFISSRPL